MVRGHLLAAGFKRRPLDDRPKYYDLAGTGVYTEVWESDADKTVIELDWDMKTPDPSPALENRKVSPALHALLDHLKEYSNAVSNDLETGVHWMNNLASEEFAKGHPSQLRWADKMAQLIEDVEANEQVYI